MASTLKITKILIANRGEIAVRVIRACQAMGIETVAVYSEIDKNAMHVRLADEAYAIGKSNPLDSYLSIEKVIEVALKSKADAIHPGYGFLSENAKFAEIVAQNGLIFIGPTSEAINSMGDKSTARTLMEEADVAIVPGYQPGNEEHLNWKLQAEKIGYPLLVKAVAGGGGKGMRVVKDQHDLEGAIEAAMREAKNAFGDDRIYIEKLIEHAHHIEFQILADQHGNVIHLGERECSIQRRHQKIIEETPSPLLDDSLRKEMGEVAVSVAKKINYVNAGTIEFIVDANTKKFYFLEMNTRLQVEHPITELVTGIDLVAWQIKIASGLPLDFSQPDVNARGHAIEARIYAENPANQFLPETGKILKFSFPEDPKIRLDSGVETGDEVSIFYDPMLAKVSVLAQNRNEAILRLGQALKNAQIFGVVTNLEFLRAVLESDTFNNGTASTNFIEHSFADWQSIIENEKDKNALLISAALLDYFETPKNSASKLNMDKYSPWDQLGDFRLGGK
jgi:acetyl-CoA carboxylase biotin carboxylase subunit